MNSSVESHAHQNGVVPSAAPVDTEARLRMMRALYAGGSAGLRTFTVPATALRVKDNAWAPLFASLARAEMIYDKLPDSPTRLRTVGLIVRVVSAASAASALATRKEPAWLPLAAIAVGAALASAYVGASLRVAASERGVPDLLLAAVEDQISIHWAARAFPAIEPERVVAPAIKTVSLL